LIIVQAFDMFTPGHIAPGTWVGDNEANKFDDLHYWIDQANLLERGKFHGIFSKLVALSLTRPVGDWSIPT
jgi:hypothetical protein